MQLKQLWDAPKESWNGCSNIKFQFDGLNSELKISYLDNKVAKLKTIRFSHTLCYKHETNYMFMPTNGALECLCQVEKSEWLQKIKSFNPEVMIDNLIHFIFDNQNDGRFEIIAEKFNIE